MRNRVPSGAVRLVDGNALAGPLAGLFAVDASGIVLVCGHCGAAGPLGGATVEDDRVAAIVRCRGCTRTLLTVLRAEGAISVVLAGLARFEVPADPR
ncbi:DUF6510 family protein [Microbacterium terricola]|uniref:Uncharacterized protein n=1 Tax=Microbacterium terricola TaxID=344163 RepID=A0ABM8DWF9_9MICO|nr:DUF6510 family protein [Microbacterium terricola]UYK39286.1 DUF6510 family protein [Microbacterium terricola]BDV29993.1 hypothetical protein Microterr_06530 [Microbacterium terricola]